MSATNKPRLAGENERAGRPTEGTRGLFTDLAIRSGAMTDAGELSDEMFRFATLVAAHCAEIADRADQGESSAPGDRIRNELAT